MRLSLLKNITIILLLVLLCSVSLMLNGLWISNKIVAVWLSFWTGYASFSAAPYVVNLIFKEPPNNDLNNNKKIGFE